ncbi:sensor domain-containing phosphodiesterase [Geodermatophilus sp. SYSU D00815]
MLGRIVDDPWVTWLLETARERVGTDVAYLADFTESEQRVRLVAGDLDALEIAAGTAVPLEGTFCVRVLAGLVPPVVSAAARDNRTRDLAEPFGIGAYVGAPIRAPDGRAVGMLCCLGRGDGAGLDADSARFVEFLAELVSQRIGVLDDEERARDRFVAELPGQGMRTVFQPIVEIGSGRTVAYEALTRFDGADTATVFAQAALSGRGTAVEHAALAAVLAVLDARPLDVPLSVNLSPDALVDPGVLDLLLAERPQVVGVEITEHRPIRDYSAVLEVRRQLRDAGLPVSVDDAGAGYASLRHVLKLEPDTIKLDAGIVSGVHADPARQALVAAMVGFAADIGATVVAEGVEVVAERDLLVSLGVRFGQGWLWGRPGPLPADEELPRAG